jgi:glycosyltransferase involved in cell wall biosynthesis
MNESQRRRARVLMVGPYPRTPDRINGGVAAALMYLSEALVASGEIELVGVRISKDEADASESSKFGWTMRDLPLGRLSLTTLYRRQVSRFAELIREFEPDIVHAQGADIGGYVAVRSGKPTVVTVHGLLAECARFQTEFASRLRASLAAAVTERATIRRAPHLIAITPYVTRYYSGDITGKVHDIPNAISHSFFDVTPAPESGRFLYAGRISNGKGLVELLQAFVRTAAPHWTLVLAGATGDPGYESMLREQVRAADVGDRIRFAGLLDEATLLREFAVAQALVLPSFQETAPMVVQQSMAAGLPVIATNVGGIPHQLSHNATGLVFEAGNVAQLADLMGQVASRPEWARGLGAAARAEARQRYRAGAVADATIAVYREMLASDSANSNWKAA